MRKILWRIKCLFNGTLGTNVYLRGPRPKNLKPPWGGGGESPAIPTQEQIDQVIEKVAQMES